MGKLASFSVQLSKAECFDPDQLGQFYVGANERFFRTTPGPFHARLQKAALGELVVHKYVHSAPLLLEGFNPNRYVTIGFLGSNATDCRMLGELFTNCDVYFLSGPGAEYMAHMMPRQHAIQVFVRKEVLEDQISARMNRDPLDFTRRFVIQRMGEQAVRELFHIVAELFEATAPMIRSPASFEAVEQLEATLIEKIVAVLMAGGDEFFGERPLPISSTGKILLRTREFFKEQGNKQIALSNVCQAVGVGQRALQLAFAKGLGISPMRYLKLRRLNNVRKQLREASPDPVLVKQAALRAGFTHMGQFARDYRELFGESPSETRGA